ncbi:MAG TPA: CAP domain-containing protein, partial [Chitinophagaceae bacterium]|nr:CAP domain-containing protein [Chitinophagaceae bacterium]
MKTNLLIISFLTFTLLITSCSKAAINNESMDSSDTGDAANTVNKTLILQLVNKARAKGCQCGDTYYYPAEPVSWNTQLEAAAYKHSTDMYKNDYFSHTGADGTNGGARIDAAGYKWTAYGENIGKGYTTENQVVEGWLKSPTHCKNI